MTSRATTVACFWAMSAACTAANTSSGASAGPVAGPTPVNLTLTAVQGLRVGHFTLAERPTGCTVILAKEGNIASVDVRGAAPGTRETDILSPVNESRTVDAIVLSGGSAYGLDAASGVEKWLGEHGVGHSDGPTLSVPVVSSAVLIDLWFGGSPKVRPGADCGYRAADAASEAPVQEGNVGAGAGATVGKFLGLGSGRGGPMKAGIGSSAIKRTDGLVVAAIVAVNALGDIVDPMSGRIVAGVRGADGRLADARALLRAGRTAAGRAGDNTTIGVVATNARLTKVQMQKVAQMAHDGYARAISPVHTLADGDTIFSLATGAWSGQVSDSAVGALAADVMADAIVRAAVQASSSHGLPSARQLDTVPRRFKQ